MYKGFILYETPDGERSASLQIVAETIEDAMVFGEAMCPTGWIPVAFATTEEVDEDVTH